MLSAQHPSGKLARWNQFSCEFDLELKYRPGREYANADALSRAPVDSSDCCNESNEIQVAQVSHAQEDMQQPLEEVRELQEVDVEVG